MIPTDKIPERGPFDIIGDLHGCADELEELLSRLGYAPSLSLRPSPFTHPDARKAKLAGLAAVLKMSPDQFTQRFGYLVK